MDMTIFLVIGIVGILMVAFMFLGLRDEKIEYIEKVFCVLCPFFVVLVVIGYLVIAEGVF